MKCRYTHPDMNKDTISQTCGSCHKVSHYVTLFMLHKCYAPQPPVNPRHWTTNHPQSDMDLAVNHQPYPSVTDQRTQASIPVPTFFGASTHSLIKHQPLFPRIVIAHADSFLPNPVVANFVCTLDLSLPHARFPQCLELV